MKAINTVLFNNNIITQNLAWSWHVALTHIVLVYTCRCQNQARSQFCKSSEVTSKTRLLEFFEMYANLRTINIVFTNTCILQLYKSINVPCMF